jgi:recombination protein RecA
LPVRPEEREAIIARINRKYDGDIKKGSEYERPRRISTGSLELDVAMGVTEREGVLEAGIPIGRWSRFYGGYHSTKTLSALSVIAEAQRMGFTCAYYNVEKQYDPVFAKKNLGVDVDELTLVEGTTVEEIGEKMEALFGVCHVHVIDSTSIAVSEDELNADVRDWRPGISARAWGKVFRRLNERFDHVGNTVIQIDQITINMRTGGEDPKGGKVFDHQASMTCHFKKGSWLFRNDEGHLDDKAKQEKGSSGQIEPSGYEVKCRVEKSRVGRPFRSATLRLDLDTMQFDRIFEYVKAAKHYNVVDQRGAYFYIVDKDGEVKERFQGEKQLRNYIAENEDFQDKIRDTALQAGSR